MLQTSAAGLLPEQCRAARAFLNWTQDTLAERAGISRSTVRGFEGEHHVLHRTTEAQLVRVLEDAGICFLNDSRQGPGVRLRRPEVGLKGSKQS
ncbi:helix-turn-helix transcriptional regulator [Pseudochelatococcus sp. G4_1912]|uniref:helix-turn-helix transcriptional regulator n=1 Tax=Pseudochelatococcus sp. G4_1912 TaxID=3114288 RepID=UPI0039C6CE43